MKDAIQPKGLKMKRYVKGLGLALAAMLVLGAVAAGGASAQEGLLTADGPVLLDGTETPEGENYLSAFGQTIECPGSTYRGEAVGGGLIKSGASSGTLVAEFAPCQTAGGLKVTVHPNGCDVVISGGETIGEGEYEGSGEMVCPENAEIDIEVFLSASNENIKSCTITGQPQEGVGVGKLVNLEGGKGRVSGVVTGIEGTKSGLCGSGTSSESEIHFDAEVVGTDEAEENTEVEVSD